MRSRWQDPQGSGCNTLPSTHHHPLTCHSLVSGLYSPYSSPILTLLGLSA